MLIEQVVLAFPVESYTVIIIFVAAAGLAIFVTVRTLFVIEAATKLGSLIAGCPVGPKLV